MVKSFVLALPLITTGVFIAWMIHIALIDKFPERNRWYRYIIASTIMIGVSTVIYMFLRQYVPILHDWAFQIMRIINILALNAIIYMISNYIMLLQTKKKLDLENEELRFVNLEARYKILLNQINPHFLFNSIGTAKSLIRKDPALADEYLVKLSSFLRLGFNNKPADALILKDELRLCDDYIDLQQIRFGEALQFEVHIDVPYLNFKVPYFSLLTLLENAVKHNTMTLETPLKIVVRNEHQLLTVSNNFQEKFLLETSGKTGLQNLAERYRLLFNEPITVRQTDDCFSVTIKLMPS
jgi:two-component system LytT family sensor kinase